MRKVIILVYTLNIKILKSYIVFFSCYIIDSMRITYLLIKYLNVLKNYDKQYNF